MRQLPSLAAAVLIVGCTSFGPPAATPVAAPQSTATVRPTPTASPRPTAAPTQTAAPTHVASPTQTAARVRTPGAALDRGILVLATPLDGRLVILDVYPSDPTATITVRRHSESGDVAMVGTYAGGVTFVDGPLESGRYLYEATGEIDGAPMTVYSPIAEVADDVPDVGGEN